MPSRSAIAATTLIWIALAGGAELRASEAGASFIFNGERILISSGNVDAVQASQRFSGTGTDCAGLCIAPMEAAPGVATLGELEVLEFLTTEVAENRGLMVDARLPQDRAAGFIPGTVSLPHSTLSEDKGFRDEILRALGAREFEGVFNFADARRLLVYDNGPTGDAAHRLVGHLMDAGYPADRISYYRGGMQVWSALGFSIEQGRM